MPTNITLAGTTTGRTDEIVFLPEQLGEIQLNPTNLRWDDGGVDPDFIRSIATHGQIQPGTFRFDSQRRPVLITGNKRLIAIRDYINVDPAAWGAAGNMSFKATLRKVSEEAALAICRDENDQRHTTSPVDRAFAAGKLRNLGWDDNRVADFLGLSRQRLSQIDGLVTLPTRVLRMAHTGVIGEAFCRQLRGLDADTIAAFADRVDGGEKPSKVLREVKDAHRATGKRKARSMPELRVALKAAAEDSLLAADILAWIDGDPEAVGDLKTFLCKDISVDYLYIRGGQQQ